MTPPPAPARLEANKKLGVCYALTPGGLELPVIDITHPAFAEPALSDAELRERFTRFLERSPFRRLPRFLRSMLFQRMMRRSLVGRCLLEARNSFVSGTSTYLMKLGPDMLGAAYAQPLDRHFAQGPSLLAMRLRLHDMAHYLAECLRPVLAASPQAPLHFVDIAGGPAADAWNALLLLHQRQPELLDDRPIAIDVFDQDEAGPAFGRAALAALCAPGAPLAGLTIAFRHIPYDWRDTAPLQSALAARAPATVTIASSEGGLFDYGSDAAVEANLAALRQPGGVLAVAGTFTSNDPLTRKMREGHSPTTQPRTPEAFAALAARAGWQVAALREIPLNSRFLLHPGAWRQLGGALSASGRTLPGIEARTKRPTGATRAKSGGPPPSAALAPAATESPQRTAPRPDRRP